ncbi:hypothetical protein Hypma_003338 [Hypsizygus marmoreus]|uniref:Uncharacterized protein n=1 Tax=Hypsizygus marmoreus TaxID=39966 RepID=A0A369J6X2_HYPMA|nr:hypothetical protein Hypma_003338 [Hypsizygus marmoreus]
MDKVGPRLGGDDSGTEYTVLSLPSTSPAPLTLVTLWRAVNACFPQRRQFYGVYRHRAARGCTQLRYRYSCIFHATRGAATALGLIGNLVLLTFPIVFDGDR